MYVWLVGFRYLLSRRISWVSVLGVMVGMAAVFIVDSVMNGFITESRHVIRGRMADVMLTPRDPSISFEALNGALASVDGVGAMSPRLNRPILFRVQGFGNIMRVSQLGNFSYLQAIGIDYAKENATTDLGRFLRKPAAGFPQLDPDDPFRIDRQKVPAELRNSEPIPMLVGERVCESLLLHPYDVFKVVSFPDDVDFERLQSVTRTCVIVGTFKTDDYRFDSSTALIPIARMREFINARTDAHEVCVAIRPGFEFHTMKEKIGACLASHHLDAVVETWEDRNHNYLSAVDNERTILNVIMFFIVVVALFLVFATLSMMVTDKIKDIGILSSMGATPGGVAGIFLSCGTIIVALGLLLGWSLGFLITDNVNHIRLFLERFGVHIFRPDVYVFTEIPTQIDPPRLVIFSTGVFLFGILSSLIPAVRAGYLDPVRALRYE
ncbi:MAG: FtsX-like permease family protein [Planctomycetota bacterium]